MARARRGRFGTATGSEGSSAQIGPRRSSSPTTCTTTTTCSSAATSSSAARDRHPLGTRPLGRGRRLRPLRAPEAPLQPPRARPLRALLRRTAPARLGSITNARSKHARRLLVEAAWHHRRPPRVSAVLARRQQASARRSSPSRSSARSPPSAGRSRRSTEPTFPPRLPGRQTADLRRRDGLGVAGPRLSA